jgi:hypothetical protein
MSETEECTICTKPVQVQIMKGTGICSEKCRKIRDGEANPDRALMHAAEPPVVVNYHKTDVTGIH